MWPWVSNYFKSVFRGKFKPFPGYSSDDTGVYQLKTGGGGGVTIAIACDWGTGTLESDTVAKSITSENPDYTILGDVYYVGDKLEIEENCLNQPLPNNDYTPVSWPRNGQGSFALNGNHEMYCGGSPYFTLFLSQLGIFTPRQKQQTSYFCLETAAWRILALDTGYNSVGWPILGAIPWINQVPFIGANCRLEDGLIDWVRNVLQPHLKVKPTLVLSHHQYYTAFEEQAYTKPARQLLEFFPNQELVWIWGHEHRLGIYDSFSVSGGVKAYGRCLGNGGMPVEVSDPKKFNTSKAPLLLYDGSTHKLDDGTEVGRNGYALLSLAASTLTLDYRDLNNQSLFVERFVGEANGTLQHGCDPVPQGGLTRVLRESVIHRHRILIVGRTKCVSKLDTT